MVVAAFLLYVFYVSGLLNEWLYAMQVGNVGQSWYSNRFPAPIFYLLEMVWPYNNVASNFAVALWVGTGRFRLFCVEAKTAGQVFARLVHSYLRCFHSDSKQAMALCYASISCPGDFCHSPLSLSLRLCPENLASSNNQPKQKASCKDSQRRS